MVSDATRFLSRLALLLFVAYLLFLTNPPWNKAATATAYYSVQAFLAVTITACAATLTRVNPSPSNKVFVIGSVYASIVFAGAAIYYMFNAKGDAIHAIPAGIFLNLVAFATTALVMLVSAYLRGSVPREKSVWNRKSTGAMVVAVCLAIFVVLMYVARMQISDAVFVVAGYVVGSIALMAYVMAGVLVLQKSEPRPTFDSNRLTVAYLLLAAATVVHMLILKAPWSLWVISMCLMAIGFIVAVVATGYPFLMDIGIRSRFAYAISAAMAIVVVAPFAVAHLVEAYVRIGVVVDVGATTLIHLGAATLAAATAYALYAKTRQKPVSYIVPITLLLFSWSAAEADVVVSRLLPMYVLEESFVPYIIGCIVALLGLTIAVRRTLRPTETGAPLSRRAYAAAFLAFGLFLAVGEFVMWQMTPAAPEIVKAPLGEAIILSLSLVSLFMLIRLVMLIVGVSGGRFTFDTVGSGTAALWVVVLILKANFSDFTPGWWAAELIILGAVTAFPLALLYMYLNETKQASDLRERATLYTGFVSRAVLSHHRKAMDSLGAISMDSHVSEAGLKAVSQTMEDISRADELTRFIATLVVSERFSPQNLEPVDLIDSVKSAFDRLACTADTSCTQLQLNTKVGECYVLANSLMVDLFENLFSGVHTRIGAAKTILVDVQKTMRETKPFLTAHIVFNLPPEEADRKRDLFARYTVGDFLGVDELAYAKRLTLLYGGSIRPETEAAEKQFHVGFFVEFPSSSES